MRTILILISSLLIFSNSCKRNNPKINDELLVYNDIIDSLYNVYPQKINFIPPIGIDSLKLAELMKDCELQFANQMMTLDSLDLYTIITDSLIELSINPRYLINKMDSSLIDEFSDLLSDSMYLPSKKFNYELLKQDNINFIGISKVNKDSITDILIDKRYGEKYYIGILELSRVRFDKNKTKCIFESGFIYSPKAGAGYIYLLMKEKNKWIIKQKISSWEA